MCCFILVFNIFKELYDFSTEIDQTYEMKDEFEKNIVAKLKVK